MAARLSSTRQSPILGKFTRPQPVRALMRARLFRALDNAREHPAVWVAGPPGAGKTTLVSTYVDQRRVRTVWYRLHEDDADPATFFHYFGQAVEAATSGERAATLPHLTPEYQLNLAVFCRRFFERVCEQLRAPCVIVFDNYQEVPPDSPLHNFIRQALECLPAGVNVLLLSRGEPPPALASLRASGAMTLLGWDAIKLTAKECADIARLRNIDIGKTALQRLHDRTQGWTAGVVLALEQTGSSNTATVLPQDATPQVVFDYFAGEIFGRRDPETQALLVRAALLPSMAANRVVELTGAPNADGFLEELARGNYFTMKLAQARGAPAVYQFHPLFREFLLRRAEDMLESEDLARLRRKAAGLLEADGETTEAVALLIAAQAWGEAAQLMTAHAPETLRQGRGRILEAWLRTLPAARREQSAWALYWLGMCRLAFDPVEARAHLEQAFALFQRDDDVAGLFSAWASIIDTFVFEWGNFGPVDRWIVVIDELLARHRIPTPEIEARVTSGMFTSLMYRQPHRVDLPQWADRVQAGVLASPHLETQVLMGNQLVLYHTLCIGDVAKARLLVDAVRPRGNPAGLSPFAAVAWRCVEAAYYLSIAEPEECLRAVESGLEIAEREGVAVMNFFLLSQAVLAKLRIGDYSAAAALLERDRAAVRATRLLDRAHFHFLRSLFAYYTGDTLSAVENGRQAVALSDTAGAPVSQAFYRLALALALFDAGRRREATVNLSRARRMGRAARSWNIEFGCYFSLAFFALEAGKRRLAMPLVRRAMELSRASGYVNRLLWTPRNLTSVVAAALESNFEVEHAHSLIRKYRLEPMADAANLENWPYPVRIRTLGRFSVELDGKPLAFSRKAQRKPLELLMALIAFGGRDVSERQLTEALWPDGEGDAVHQACAMALHRLRRLLGHDAAITLQRNHLSLNPRLVWVDTWAFERGRTPDKTIALYQGPFLQTEVDLAWAIPYRERLRAKFTRLLAEYGQSLLASGEFSAAVAVFEKGLNADPLAEEFYRQLMACYQALDRRAEAIGVYRRCETTLATLGVAPGAKTIALFRTLHV
jgi:LuxR family maltose regulon positive regulatory protein